MHNKSTVIISVNGEKKQLTASTNITELLQQFDFDQLSVAVAVNCEFVAKSHYEQRIIVAGDEIDVLSPIAGG